MMKRFPLLLLFIWFIIIGFVGEMRSGKTLMMSYFLAQDYRLMKKDGRKPLIFANYKLSFPCTVISPKSMSDAAVDKENDIFKECSIGIDEMHVFMDSRTSGAKRNRLIGLFCSQSGKQKNTLYWTSQFLRQVDVRLRMNTSILYRTTRGIVNPLTGRFSKLQQDDTRTDFLIKLERMEMQDTPKGLQFMPVWTQMILDPRKYFKLYDTRERVFLLEEDDVVVKKKSLKVTNDE